MLRAYFLIRSMRYYCTPQRSTIDLQAEDIAAIKYVTNTVYDEEELIDHDLKQKEKNNSEDKNVDENNIE